MVDGSFDFNYNDYEEFPLTDTDLRDLPSGSTESPAIIPNETPTTKSKKLLINWK